MDSICNNDFCVISINYKKTALNIRNKFAFTTEQIKNLYQDKNYNLFNFIVLSTCNRTEVYLYNKDIDKAINFLIEHSNLNKEEALKYINIKLDKDAIKHLFRVASGLDSQILGDYEIVGQLKNAFLLAKCYNKLNGIIEKIYNVALETSKEIKNNTKISDGTTSVSFFTIQFLKNIFFEKNNLNITILGIGKIGLNTLKNLCCYMPNATITIVNRNELKSIDASKKFKINYLPFEKQNEALLNADVLIVATGAQNPIIFKEHIINTNVKYVFDLSVPSNVDKEVATICNVKLINVDELSNLVNKTMQQRELELPKALQIIEKQYSKFLEWHKRRLEYLKYN